jgi:bacteriorhodopsin
MHQREILAAGEGTMTDTMHIVFLMVTVLLLILSIGFGQQRSERASDFIPLQPGVILLVFGILTGMQAPGIEVNGSTSLIVVWERINIGVYMLWFIVLPIILIQVERRQD